ncbi:hypothetical protein M441DRAFT_342915 [Trichoderma asperellum CBS 433.97]|uniref:Uncharacterized protein n=1 Tax=Trichoderma asperellum (strain ATCC 204424 / CBS 433.97 / NBRC 101777) TaxID=1042311 RepID=A0A2T3ZH84_TRIA4|nr:hypothetical protein M441DRAFT_342915 [Trichoderma asperellum CBS 433.97]PTB44175.1 hypothetical protein M441DRAFT_342915 [Trichoderma asperellum CBS 433.97]
MDGCGGRGADQRRLTDDSREDLMYKQYTIQTDAVCFDPVFGRQIRPLLHHNPSMPPNPYFSPCLFATIFACTVHFGQLYTSDLLQCQCR